MRYSASQWGWMLLPVVLLIPHDISSNQDGVPIGQQASFLLRALSFDRNLKKRSPEGIHIAVLYRGDEKEPAEIAEAFNEAGKDGVRDLSVKATAVPFESVAKLLKRIDTEGINAIYIHPSIATGLSSVQQVTRGKKVPSIGGTKKQVEQGASLGVYPLGDALKIVINLRASRVEGLRFGAGLLNIATVIK